MGSSVATSQADGDAASWKLAAAEAAAALVEHGMVVGLGSGSTASLAIAALAARCRQGLRFLGIATSEETAALASGAGIPLRRLDVHLRVDLTIDGADQVERGTLHALKGRGGALLREKIVAAASDRLVLVVDDTKLVDRLGAPTPVPVEVVTFGLEMTHAALEALGATVELRLTAAGVPFVTDGGNRILDCRFGAIDDPAALEARIARTVGTIESGLFVGRADLVLVGGAGGVRRLERPPAVRPRILVVMGVSGAGKTTIAGELARRLGWPLAEGDALHPASNVAKLRAGQPLTDADRAPWLAAAAAWVDCQRARGEPGILTCSALTRRYREVIVGARPDVQLVYLRGGSHLIAERLAGRHGHFMPAALLPSQLEVLEEPGDDEAPLVVEIGPAAGDIAATIIERLAASDGRMERR